MQKLKAAGPSFKMAALKLLPRDVAYASLIAFLLPYSVVKGYHLSLNKLDWNEAAEFCYSVCDSHLAAIHTQSENEEAIALLQHNPFASGVAWLGCHDSSQSDQWEWNDGSNIELCGNVYDSDGRLTSGVYPWADEEPRFNSSDDYAFISERDNYQWIARYVPAVHSTAPSLSEIECVSIMHIVS